MNGDLVCQLLLQSSQLSLVCLGGRFPKPITIPRQQRSEASVIAFPHKKVKKLTVRCFRKASFLIGGNTLDDSSHRPTGLNMATAIQIIKKNPLNQIFILLFQFYNIEVISICEIVLSSETLSEEDHVFHNFHSNETYLVVELVLQ